MNLETELRALEIDWPETPQLRLELSTRRRRWPLAATLAVPQSRGAILRFFHLGGATVRFVDTLPPADERPLTDGLGTVIPLSSAKRFLPGLLLPAARVPIHYSFGNVVSLVFEHDGRPVLLSELPGAGGSGYDFLKKLASGGSRVGTVLLWAHGSTTYRLEGPNLTKEGAIGLAESLRKG